MYAEPIHHSSSSLEKRHLIILGGNGFFGQQFVTQGKDKYNLVVVDAALPPPNAPNVPFVQGDFSSLESANKAIEAARDNLPALSFSIISLRNVTSLFMAKERKVSLFGRVIYW